MRLNYLFRKKSFNSFPNNLLFRITYYLLFVFYSLRNSIVFLFSLVKRHIHLFDCKGNLSFHDFCFSEKKTYLTQQTLTYLKSIIETLEKGVKSSRITTKIPERRCCRCLCCYCHFVKTHYNVYLCEKHFFSMVDNNNNYRNVCIHGYSRFSLASKRYTQ